VLSMAKDIMGIKLQKRLLEERLEITDVRISRLNNILLKKTLQKSGGIAPRQGASQTFGSFLPVIAASSHDAKMTASGCTLGDLRVERTQRWLSCIYQSLLSILLYYQALLCCRRSDGSSLLILQFYSALLPTTSILLSIPLCSPFRAPFRSALLSALHSAVLSIPRSIPLCSPFRALCRSALHSGLNAALLSVPRLMLLCSPFRALFRSALHCALRSFLLSEENEAQNGDKENRFESNFKSKAEQNGKQRRI
jgi:hypothetical protein